MVLVPVTVTNRSGAAVDGLAESSFTVLENKIPQPIVSFGSQDLPASIGVIVDLSGSMETKLDVATRALHAFYSTANPADEAFLVTVSTRPETASLFSRDFGSLETELLGAHPDGATALVDTICLALQRIRAAHNKRKVLLIASDGMDNHSRYSERELMRRVRESDVQIYTIGMAQSSAGGKAIEWAEEQNGLKFLDRVAEESGGLSFRLADREDPAAAARKISHAVRNQYLIGYRPLDDGHPGEWRPIQVKVSLPQARVSSRTGYYARPATD
jgi:Ca-activated chloride channel family protein